MNKHFFAVILAGGKGERFWPLSTSRMPKQFLSLVRRLRLLDSSSGRDEGTARAPELAAVHGREGCPTLDAVADVDVDARDAGGGPWSDHRHAIGRHGDLANEHDVAREASTRDSNDLEMCGLQRFLAQPNRLRASLCLLAALARLGVALRVLFRS